ncbi:MAG: membrane protein insertase YidC [Candidatus Omnitrophota bacterium]|nr:membrane protein insertase YidC [Candidatus Omnitrophota bacterium]
MEKRLFTALALSLAILFLWQGFVARFYPTDRQADKFQEASQRPVSVAQVSPAVPSYKAQADETPQLIKPFAGTNIAFSESLAAIKDINYPQYQDYNFVLREGFRLGLEDLVFKKVESATSEMVFRHQDSSKEIIKRYIFSNTQYLLRLEIEIRNIGTQSLITKLPLTLGIMSFSNSDINSRYQDVTISMNDKIVHSGGKKDYMSPNEIKFVGLRDRYFSAIIEPESEDFTNYIRKINNEYEVGIISPELKIGPNESIKSAFNIYLGPQELGTIKQINPEWSAIIYYGNFDLISNILFQILQVSYKVVRSWGWAIVILSILIYLLVFPLTLKQMRSMREMQILQPKIEGLKKTYKDNQQRLNKEIMELYKEHKVNPMGGCLPMILQIPIFFALYQVLTRTIVLKGASFLWIKDLSEPDRLFRLQNTPFINEINILPILMAIIMFVQQKMSMAKAKGSSAEQQKMMMVLMPIIFAFIFYRMPSGLVLYWFINSALMLIFQAKINRPNEG